MREILFNSFKAKILNGKVPDTIPTSGIAVNSKFFDQYDNNEISIEQYRNVDDFETYSNNVDGAIPFDDTKFEYGSYRVEYSAYEPDDLSEKPIFVNSDNSAKFFQAYQNDVGDEDTRERLIGYMTADSADLQAVQDLKDVNSGFYYISKKTHLHWIAERCNADNNFNNKIRIVFGDDIGNENDRDSLESMICTTPERPFNGILDFNGHKIVNKRFVCENNSNGLVGYLGPRGVVRNAIVQDIVFDNRKKISIDKIVNDCSDVFAGSLVGTNYGLVENIVTSGTFRFDGFCPEVYLTNNKYEYTEGDSTFVSSAYNGFFPNKFCINSIYNILPYCGYFSEGADSFFNDIGRSDIALTDVDINEIVKNNVRSLLGFAEFNGHNDDGKAKALNFNHYTEPKMSISDMFDQSSIRLSKAIPSTDVNARVAAAANMEFMLNEVLGDVSFVDVAQDKAIISPMLPIEYTQEYLDRVLCNSINSLKEWKSNDEQATYTIRETEINEIEDMVRKDLDHGSYLAQQIRDAVHMSLDGERNSHHQRLNPEARIAYYCSPIVGNNFGTIRNVDCLHTVKESENTFVGFIGNVCGKQNCGSIEHISSMYDIASLNEDEAASSECITKTYTKNKEYLPEYPDDYTNISQVFGYNYDYFQSPHGITDPEELETYSAAHEESVMVSKKFYDFHDFVCSGVNGNWYNNSADPTHEYTFNKYTPDSAYGNCNFSVSDDASIGSAVPPQLREAKLTFGNGDSLDEFRIYFELEKLEQDNAPLQGEVRLYDSFDDRVKGNAAIPLCTLDGQDREDFTDAIENLEFTVKHFELNYLGDSCKSVSYYDSLAGLASHAVDGNQYQLTAEDVLKYSRAFNGECGSTVDNAAEFATNILRAKVAMGGNLLANPFLDDPSRNTDEYWEPFRREAIIDTFGRVIGYRCPVGGPYGTRNIDEPWDARSDDGKYVISSGVGPNDTNQDWTIFSNSEDAPAMSWYMPPAPNSYGPDGPESTNPSRSMYGKTVNDQKFDSNLFCSVRPDLNYDILFKNDSQFNEYSQFGLQRSMITIEPMQSSSLETAAKNICLAMAKTGMLSMYTGDSDGRTPEAMMEEFFGEDWSARIRKIHVPLQNRTQNKTAFSDAGFLGVNRLRCLYLDFQNSAQKYFVYREGSQYKLQTNGYEWRSTATPRVGNLDDMFIDMTILRRVDEENLVPYNVIIRMPVRNLRVPISAFRSDIRIRRGTEKFTVDLANWGKIVNGITDTHWERSVDFYPLVPAFDPEDTNGLLQSFKLKSIYNIGGVAGMINHSQKFEEYGNWMTDVKYNGTVMGRIDDVQVKLTAQTLKFINGLAGTKISEDGSIVDADPRVIGIASKFSLLAPVLEYHQNEVGTSPDPGINREDGSTANTDMLTHIYGCQYTRITNVDLLGCPEAETVNTRLYKPLIEWINFSDVLDYNSILYKRFNFKDDRDSVYTPHTSTNYPETIDVLHDFCSLAGNFDYDLKLRGYTDNFMSRRGYPAYDKRHDDTEDGLYPSGLDANDAISSRELSQFGHEWPSSVRNSRAKRYENVPSWFIYLQNVNDVPDGQNVREEEWFTAHMNPMIDAPNSDYGDIDCQLLNGTPNFVFDKLNKTTIDSMLFADNENRSPRLNLIRRNEKMLDQYSARTASGITDRYFTWDYDMYPRESNDPLDFTIKYAQKRGVRGLWIHQSIDAIDRDPDSWLRYAMKGSSECINDGSCIHLGYMPSEWELINIMNREDRNLLPEEVGDEGVSVDGRDFRGILLCERDSRDLIALLDCGFSRDISSGCYVADLPMRWTDESSGYGLLCEIKTDGEQT